MLENLMRNFIINYKFNLMIYFSIFGSLRDVGVLILLLDKLFDKLCDTNDETTVIKISFLKFS
jgi:hypothetical protein